MSMERMMKARAGLLALQPFFGVLAYKLELVEDPTCKTTWTDGKSLGFNPEWAATALMPDMEAAVAHQVFTCAMSHHLRRGGRDSKLWNDASDYVVNAELKRAGFTLPEGSLVDDQYQAMHAEAVYAALDQKPQAGDDQNQDQQQPGGQDQGGGGGQGKPGAQPGQDQGGNPTQAPGAQQAQPGGSGEGATGRVQDAPGDQPGQPADEASKAEQEADWQAAVAQAAQVARAAGKLPGSVERVVEQVLNAKVDWREALQRLLLGRAKEDYNWSKPSPRWMQVGLYLPSLDSVACDDLAFAVDMSGSINQETVDQWCAELNEARQVLKPKRTVVMLFDTRVRKVLEFGPDDPVEFKVKAGGGTAFDDPVRVLDEMGCDPEVLVYLTDLDSRAFPDEPSYPVVWCTTRKTYAPFGEVIEMY